MDRLQRSVRSTPKRRQDMYRRENRAPQLWFEIFLDLTAQSGIFCASTVQALVIWPTSSTPLNNDNRGSPRGTAAANWIMTFVPGTKWCLRDQPSSASTELGWLFAMASA